MTKPSDNDELVDSIYAVAMEPERLLELIDIWQEKIRDVNDDVFQAPASEKKY